MLKLCKLAIAGVFVLGLSTAASAAPVLVTYGIVPGTGSASSTPNPIFGTPSSGNGGGQMVVLYTTGAPTTGGSLGPVGQVQAVNVTFTVVGAILGTNPVPGMGVAVGLPIVGGAGVPGATVVPASLFGPGLPPATVNGNVASLNLGALLNGSGTQGVGPITWAWTISNAVYTEISRAVVPEPSTAYLLAGALGALALAGASARRMRR